MTILSRTAALPVQTPTNSHFSFWAGPRMYAVLESATTLSSLQTELREGGYAFQVLHGQNGIRALDQSGSRGGLLMRLNRWLQGLTEERGKINGYVWALHAGRLVVAVNMPRDDSRTKAALRQTFANAGAIQIDYFGHLLTEEMSVKR